MTNGRTDAQRCYSKHLRHLRRRCLAVGRELCKWLVGFFACLVPFDAQLAADDPPNVILLMADDLGWGDVKCFRPASPIDTPHLDQLAATGLKLTRFYSGAPVCSPTRGSCLTGRHPLRYGIRTANDGHLRSDEVTLAELLKSAGYATGHFGKWHLGTLTPDYSGKGSRRRPQANFCTPGMSGFDEWFSTEFAVATWDPYARENSHLPKDKYDTRAIFWHNGANVDEPLSGCTSQLTMDRALPFIHASVERQQPFFSVIWFHAPHAPVVGGPGDRARYASYSEDEQHYFAVVTALDRQVGRLVEHLDRFGITENTMIWFCSDNGPEGNPGPRGRSQGDAGPFRGRKRSLYEGGVRVPGIVSWPAKVRPGRVSDQPCVTSDYLPTIMAAIGASLPSDLEQSLDGVNLLPLLEGEADYQRAKPIGFQFGRQSSWVEPRFKLVHNHSDRRLKSDNGEVPVADYELYDLIADPSESKNVAADHPAKVERMRESLEAWRASLSDG